MEEYKILESKVLLKTRIFDLHEDLIRIPTTGHTMTRIDVTHPGSVVFIPQTADGSLLLVRQYRHATRSEILEFPAGTLDHPVEGPLEAAKREICEEVKYAANTWIDLGFCYPAPGFCNQKEYGFLARDLTPCEAECDEDEIIIVEKMSIAEFEDAIRDGDIIDSKSITFFAKAKFRGLL